MMPKGLGRGGIEDLFEPERGSVARGYVDFPPSEPLRQVQSRVAAAQGLYFREDTRQGRGLPPSA